MIGATPPITQEDFLPMKPSRPGAVRPRMAEGFNKEGLIQCSCLVDYLCSFVSAP